MPTKILTRFAFFAWVLCATGTVHAQLPPILDYVNHPDFDSARLSPDGLHIALVAPRDDTEVLTILDTATLQVKASFETSKNTGVYRYWWANEERIVFSTSVNFGGGDQVSMTGDLFALNVDNTQKYQLAGPSMGQGVAYMVLDTMQNDRENIMVATWPIRNRSIARSQPVAYLMNIYTPPTSGASIRIDVDRISDKVSSPLPWGEIATDHDGNVRLAYATNDEGKLQIKVRQEEEWRDVATFFGVEADGVNSQLGTPIGFNSTNTGIYHLARSEYGTVGVALFDITSGQSNLLYAHEKYDVTNADLVMSADDKDLLGVTMMGALPERHYFSEHPDVALYRGLDKLLPGYRVNFLNFTADQRKALAMISSPTIAPGLFLLDRDKGEFTPLYSSMPKLQGSPMTVAEPVSLTARDGTPIEGYLTLAALVDGPAPLVVLVHGGPHGIRDNPVFNPEVKLLASRGYSVLQVNYRGSGGYGLDFQALGYRNWGKSMIDDIADATRYVVEQGKVVPDRICVMGASYGGYAAMMALARYPDVYKCGVGISGVYDLTMMRKGDVPFLPGGEAFLEQIIGSDETQLAASSPVALASAIKAPVFLAHGGADRRAPKEHAERLKDAFDDAGVPYEWFYVRSAGHGFALPENREKLYTGLFEFFSANL